VAKSKRERKISKVMGEFKEGTLKSGGSGKQVTNPKQAIAIALSEANAMNQGGMMYNEIMNRPMFQTPQMREGGGIMAGVAPIRGYADGDFVGDLAESIRGFNPYEYLSNIDSEILDEISNITPEEALEIIENNPKSQIAIALLTAFPALKIGKAGLQGIRALRAKRPTKMTEADIATPKPGPRAMGERDIMGTNVGSGQSGQRVIKQGERFDPRSQRTETKPASRKADEPKTDAPKTDTPEANASSGKIARAKEAVSSATSRAISPIRATSRGLKTAGKVGAGAAAAAGATDLAFGTDYLSSGLSAALNAALKAGRITREQYDQFMATPEVSALLESFRAQPTPPLTPTTTPTTEVVVTKETGDDQGTKKTTFLDMLKGAGTQFKDFLQDPANQYALARASQPREGIAPMNFASDFAVAKEEYKQLEADRDTALISNYQFLKDNTDLSDEEILSKLSGEETSVEQFLSLFGPGLVSGTVGIEDIQELSKVLNLGEPGGETGITLDAEGNVVGT